METLKEYLNTNKPSGFNPVPYYSEFGDSLTFLAKDAPYYRKRIDDFLTVYLSRLNDDLVGCQIKGITHAIKLFGNFGMTVSKDEVSLSVLFRLLPELATPSTKDEHFYIELSKIAKTSEAFFRMPEQIAA